MPRRRFSLALAVTVASVAGPVAIAQADDASFKAVALRGIQTLAPKEQSVRSALAKVHGRSGVPRAKLALRSARKLIRSFRGQLAAEAPSSDAGRRARTLLLSALKAEDSAYRQINGALNAAKRGERSRSRRLLAHAKKALASATKKGEAAGRRIAGLITPSSAAGY